MNVGHIEQFLWFLAVKLMSCSEYSIFQIDIIFYSMESKQNNFIGMKNVWSVLASGMQFTHRIPTHYRHHYRRCPRCLPLRWTLPFSPLAGDRDLCQSMVFWRICWCHFSWMNPWADRDLFWLGWPSPSYLNRPFWLVKQHGVAFLVQPSWKVERVFLFSFKSMVW